MIPAAAVLSCRVQPDRWVAPHLAVGALSACSPYSSLACFLVACC